MARLTNEGYETERPSRISATGALARPTKRKQISLASSPPTAYKAPYPPSMYEQLLSRSYAAPTSSPYLSSTPPTLASTRETPRTSEAELINKQPGRETQLNSSSVQESPDAPTAGSQAIPTTDPQPSLVVPMKIASRSQDTEPLRKKTRNQSPAHLHRKPATCQHHTANRRRKPAQRNLGHRPSALARHLRHQT
jgi:hypothetical protein